MVERLTSWCKACAALAEKKRKRRLEGEGVDVKAKKRVADRRWRASLSPKKLAALREREREWQVITRRKRNEGSGNGSRSTEYGGGSLPVAPLLPLLEAESELGNLAKRSGVDQRRIYGLLHGEYETAALSTVDKLLHGLGQEHMLPILYPEEP